MRRISRALAMGAALSLTGSLGLAAVAAGGSSPASAAPGAPPAFSVTTNPPLIPAFDPSVHDYAIRCTSSPTTTITTTGAGTVTVGATVFPPGPVQAAAPLVAGQGLQISEGGSSYYARCLPSDFPAYSTTITGTVQATGFVLDLQPYAVVFDNQGVPVWWYKDTGNLSPWDVKFFSPTTIGWSQPIVGCLSAGQCFGDYVIRNLDGSLNTTLGGVNLPLDFHDLAVLPNGNYLGIMDVTTNCPAVPSQCVDLSSWGRSAQSSISDNVIVEFTPQDQIVWEWDAAQHVNVAAENVDWRDQYPDVIHMNSVLYDGNGGVIFSARHLNAVYRVDMATGAITWKLGGTTTPQSLAVSGAQYSGDALFSGQHFARLAPDGTLTVHDNGTRANRPPRGLRFSVDPTAMTATELEQVSDPRAPSSYCCGSAMKLPGGDWVMSWGGNEFTTELSPTGVPQITINYPNRFSYRAEPVAASLDALRRGMDAMVPPLTDIPWSRLVLPADGSTVSGTQVLDAPAADPGGPVTSLQFRLSGGTLDNAVIATATATIYGWAASWSSATVPNGTYTLESEAFDAAGSSSLSQPITLTVTNPPATSVLTPAPNTALAGTRFLDAGATDAGGVSSVSFVLSGGAFNQTVVSTAVPTIFGWVGGWNTTTVPDGSYTLQSFATDTTGLSAYSAGVPIVVDNPSVSSLSPSSGSGSGGSKVRINGTNLSGVTGVTFGGVPAAGFTVDSPTRITAYSPPEAAGTVDVTVVAPGTSSYVSGADRFTFLAPTVSGVSPSRGPVAGGTSVAVSGTNLPGVTQVMFGSTPATSVTVDSPTRITAKAPPGSAGTVDVTVTTPGGVSATSAKDRYTYH